MNKNVITLIGLVLVGIIGYQAYLLNKTTDTDKNKVEIKKHEPKITVNIEKKTIEEEVKELNKPKKDIRQTQPKIAVQNNFSQNQLDPNEILDEKVIKQDMEKLFKDIFGNPKLQEGIKNGISQMQGQIEQALKQMQKELENLPNELEKIDDPFFKDLLAGITGGIAQTSTLQFTDRGDNYYIILNIPGGSDSNIDIKTKDNVLTLTITQKSVQNSQNSSTTVHSESLSKNQNVIIIPDDAFIDKLQTNYENGVLEIIVPKVSKVNS